MGMRRWKCQNRTRQDVAGETMRFNQRNGQLEQAGTEKWISIRASVNILMKGRGSP